MRLPRPVPITAPGPTGRRMLGSVRAIRHDPLAFLASTRDEFGDVAQFPIPTPATYLLSDPGDVRRVLVTNARAYGKRTMQYTTLSLVTGDGLLTADTEGWRVRRPLVQPAFHSGALGQLGQHVETATDRLVRDWQDAAGPVDVEAGMLALTLQVVGAALFGADLTGSAAGLAAATVEALDVVVARVRMPLAAPPWVPTPGNLRLAAALRRLDRAVAAMTAARARDPLPPGSPPRDMLDLLLAAQGSAAGSLTARQVRDEIVTFLVAGHETVASALTWCCYLLGRDPAAAARLAAEADQVLAGHDDRVGAVAPGALPYARAVLDEALRLYPPAWLITRRAREPDLVGGVALPEGALVLISPWLIHRDPRFWHEPGRFDPGRFHGRAEPAPRGVYLPYGAGPRQCIGRDFAVHEGVLVLAALARRFRLEPVDPAPARPLAMVTVRPAGGLRMRARPR